MTYKIFPVDLRMLSEIFSNMTKFIKRRYQKGCWRQVVAYTNEWKNVFMFDPCPDIDLTSEPLEKKTLCLDIVVS